MGPGDTQSIAVDAQVDDSVPDGTVLDNTASAASDDPNADLSAGTGSVSVVVQNNGTLPLLIMSHTGNFTQGQSGVIYSISVHNSEAIAVFGGVTVTGTLPSGVSAMAMGGPGWNCVVATLTCTRADSLASGANYPPITLTVNVAANAPTQVTAQASMIGSLPPASASDVTAILAAFTDVISGDAFLPAIDLMREYGVTSGCGSSPPAYCPSNNVTRGQMAVFVVRAIVGSDNFPYTTAPYFTDVPSTHPYFKWIQHLRDLGITTGCTSATYCPDGPVTRGQMAVFIIRARYGATGTFNYSQTPVFNDVPAGSDFFQWIQKMKQLGITAGCGGSNYCPNDAVTRGQMAVFIMRGTFNQLLPAGTPVIALVSPASAAAGQAITVTLTGQNTSFASGTTQVVAGPGITVTNVLVTNAATLTVQLSVAGNAASGPRSITASTGAEDATLPNGFVVQ